MGLTDLAWRKGMNTIVPKGQSPPISITNTGLEMPQNYIKLKRTAMSLELTLFLMSHTGLIPPHSIFLCGYCIYLNVPECSPGGVPTKCLIWEHCRENVWPLNVPTVCRWFVSLTQAPSHRPPASHRKVQFITLSLFDISQPPSPPSSPLKGAGTERYFCQCKYLRATDVYSIWGLSGSQASRLYLPC